MRAAALCAFALVLTQAFSVQCMTWKSCTTNGAAFFTPDEVTLTPDPPVTGQDITFTISGTNDGGANLWTLTRSCWRRV